MSNSVSKRKLLPSALIAAVAVAAGCGDETTEPVNTVEQPATPPASAAPMVSYSGPGSNWDIDLNDDGTYAISRSALAGMDPDLSVSGSFQQTAQGFLSMTIDASSGNDAPVRGNTTWAFEIPNHALTLSPISTVDDHAVTMVGGGVCPDSDVSANWISIRASLSSNAQSTEGSYFGALDYSYGQGSTTLRTQYALTVGNQSQGEYSLGNGFCRSGIISSASSDIYLSPTGATTVHVDAASPDGGMFVLALPRATIGSIGDLDGSYAGVMTDEAGGPGQKVSPVVVTCSSGICSGDFVADVSAGTLAGTPFSVDLSGSINAPSPGLTTGTVTVGGNSGNIGCMADPDNTGTGQRLISCAGQSTMNGYALLNLILASTD
jgi:hypothetical protein